MAQFSNRAEPQVYRNVTFSHLSHCCYKSLTKFSNRFCKSQCVIVHPATQFLQLIVKVICKSVIKFCQLHNLQDFQSLNSSLQERVET